jgi:EmrB/QacA subfamily drug resistance transporter
MTSDPSPSPPPTNPQPTTLPRTIPPRTILPRTILVVVGFSVFVAADDLTVVSTMLRPIIGDLGLVLPDGLDDAAWIVNVYLIAFVAVMPLAGRLSDVVGRRRTFVGAWLVFLVGTIWIPLADSLDALLVGRVLTAIGGGAMVPIALAIVGDVYPEPRRARALGTLGAIETLGWVWGPLYGAILVRFLTWRWQFWLNVPLAIIGLVAVWWALRDHDRPARDARVDWLGATLLTVALIALNLALLGNAEVRSVEGLDALTGGSGPDLRWLYAVAVVAGVLFWFQQRRSAHPLFDRGSFRGRGVRAALIVNFVIGVALVIAMVDVPLFVNAVESDVGRAAVLSGAVLCALTAAMAVASYAGGRATERWWYGPPIVAGLVAAAAAYAVMGLTWDESSPYAALAAQLAVLGAGIGLTIAPTTSVVVDVSPPDRRGAAASTVMVVRLLGLSVGLSALTAWGLSRFNTLRHDIDLPPITDPDFERAVRDASAELTAQSIADTFLASAVVVAVGLGVAVAMLRRPPAAESLSHDEPDMSSNRGGGEPLPARPEAMMTPEPEVPTDDLPPPDAVPERAPSRWIFIAFAIALVTAFVLIGVLFLQLRSTNDDLDETRAELERVEAGAAIFSSQVTGIVEQLTELSPSISAGLDEAVAGLESFGNSTLEFDVAIDEEIEIGTEVVLDRTLSVPIKTSLPIDDEFDTQIVIDGPFGVEVPLDVTVPVKIDVPIDLVVDIPVNETIPIDATVPVKIDVPITIDVAETELAGLTASLASGLDSFRDVLGGFGG